MATPCPRQVTGSRRPCADEPGCVRPAGLMTETRKADNGPRRLWTASISLISTHLSTGPAGVLNTLRQVLNTVRFPQEKLGDYGCGVRECRGLISFPRTGFVYGANC
ncbi:hypothetical protein SKAU_G00260170 [Synaphobranchus kaupii]|uniref:Uncharacterized protein n=1 Tax=Synaphobranchus kaupii TaxID=118154 RepID=A0A9Q1IST2_SYNKA|nr:hypothetical protein SKAU_G00260170 [Synaphobranchus kaupii]